MKSNVEGLIVLGLILISLNTAFAQRNNRLSITQKKGAELDSLRKKEELGQDSVVYTAKFIRYTTIGLLKDSTQTYPIDTTLRNFHNYNPLYQPQKPTIGLGSIGLAYRELLFNPSKTIGFNAGFHSLDTYLLNSDSVRYYRARSPYTELYYVNGKLVEQVFKVTHTQNIKPNLNFGANYNRIGGEGLYANQKADHLNADVFVWYESPGKRYNLLTNGVFNTIKAGENGSTTNDNIFDSNPLRKDAEGVRLSGIGAHRPQQIWRHNSFFLKQFFYIGRIDSLAKDNPSVTILPTQRVSHAISYITDRYKFYRNEEDKYGAFPVFPSGPVTLTNDSTRVTDLRNEFNYSFYLRGKALSFITNELKLDLGLQHDWYTYEQMGYKTSFQNISLKANLGYRFSDRAHLDANLVQIAQGRNSGDYLYEANTDFLLSKSIGRIVLGAYLQNRSPEQMYERLNYQFHNWDLKFNKTKINSASFIYENLNFKFSAKAEYFLISNYLYYRETQVEKQIEPAQLNTNINLLKISIGKDFKLGKFNLDNYIVYQKTDFQDVLRTPELYSYSSFYYDDTFFKVLHTNIGFDVRFNTPFKAPAYAINAGQFYNDNNPVVYANYPLIDLWIKATLKRANLFLKYDYANQGLFSKGFYTVTRYPMQDALLKFGVSWKFYD